MKSQNQFVLDHLIDHGYITDAVAQGYRIRRLASRVHDLVRAGSDIKREVRRDDLGQKYTYYFMSDFARSTERVLRERGLNWRAEVDRLAA